MSHRSAVIRCASPYVLHSECTSIARYCLRYLPRHHPRSPPHEKPCLPVPHCTRYDAHGPRICRKHQYILGIPRLLSQHRTPFVNLQAKLLSPGSISTSEWCLSERARLLFGGLSVRTGSWVRMLVVQASDSCLPVSPPCAGLPAACTRHCPSNYNQPRGTVAITRRKHIRYLSLGYVW